MPLYHFSEDGEIRLFRPHVAATSVEAEALVGAIDEWHAPANVELRVTPSLPEIWRRVIQSTLQFSGTRLRNAKGRSPDASE